MRAIVAVLVLAFSAAAACAQDIESSYVRRTPGAQQVIVFVHGVLSDAGAWGTGENSFPRLVAADPAFAQADIFTYAYPTRMWSNLSIDEIADNMRLVLDSHEISDGRDIVFVTHSMGGLVTRSFLLKYRRFAAATKMIFFFATPTQGSEVAAIARILSGNPTFRGMSPIKSDSYLADSLRQWLASEFRIASYCAYETRLRTY